LFILSSEKNVSKETQKLQRQKSEGINDELFDISETKIKNQLIIPSQGRRKKSIVIKASFSENQSEQEKREMNQSILKNFIEMGLIRGIQG